MILFWYKPKIGALMVILICISAGILRFVAVFLGLEDFWSKSVMDSVVNGCTDVVIVMLQTYLVFDVIHLCKYANNPIFDGYEKLSSADDTGNITVEVNDEAIFNHKNPFNK